MLRPLKVMTSLGAVSIIIVLSGLLFSFSSDEPTPLENILKKIQAYHLARPQQKLYVHFDKPFYAAGDDMWLKAYLVEASFHNLDTTSKVVYVELLNQTRTLVARKVLYAPGGVTFGDVRLPDTLKGGNYYVRAYTNYMKNAGEDFFFLKEFAVVNSVGTSDQKFSADSIDFQFFPEGGNLVACGAPNRVAFKAVGPDGKSIQVEGEILDDKNTRLVSFQSAHGGMGMVRLMPETGKKYFARITKPYQVARLFELPKVQETGYALQVDETGKNIKVVVFSNLPKPASGQLPINIVVQSRGNVYHAQQGAITSTAYFTFIPRSKFPDGVSQLTLFDAEGRPVAERLIYQNQKETIQVNVQSDSAVYKQRQLVTVYIDASYRNGSPASGNFSVAVYDEGLLDNKGDKFPTTITNYLSLSSELRGRIENPGYYFKDSLPETKRHLDLLMMVHGWRRFTWTDILKDQLAPQKYSHENGIPISGQVLRAGGKKAPKGSRLKIMTMQGNATIINPDSAGRFYSDRLLYYDTMDLVLQTENEKGNKQPYKVMLDPFSAPPPSAFTVSALTSFDASEYLKQKSDQDVIMGTTGVKVLQEVEVVERRERDSRAVGGPGDRVIEVKNTGSGYMSIMEMLHGRVPGMLISGTAPNYTVTMRGQTPAFLLNGMQASVDMVSSLSPTDVEAIEVLSSGGIMYGANAVINIWMKKGAFDRVPIGVNKARYPGFYQAREFYSPQYDTPEDRHNLPDKRTTLYWEPMVDTDGAGKVAVGFFTADVSSRYRIVIEGITPDGYPGSATAVFEVK